MYFPQLLCFRALVLFVGVIALTPIVAVNCEELAVLEELAPAAEGSSCAMPHHVVFPMGEDQLTLAGLSTCSYGNDYSSTCLGSYDGGEDYIIELEVQQPMYAYIKLDPKGTTWTGMAIDNSCPPDNNCLAVSTHSGSGPHYINSVYLAAGTYYIIVDTYPSPNCIAEFDIQIIRMMVDPWGISCDLPMFTTVTADKLPMTLGPEVTTGSQDESNQTCLGIFDSGEDLYYSLTLPESLRLNIRLDPGGVPGSGFAIHDSCPPTMDCLAFATDETGQEYGVTGLSLAAGTHFLMIDTWSMSTPLTQLYVHIENYYLCGDADANEIISISDAVFLVNYIFTGGPAPVPLEAGDADQNGLVTISDAVRLISFIFAGGPAPCGG